MRSGAADPAGPSGRDDYSQPHYQSHPKDQWLEQRAMPPGQLEPLPSRDELQAIIEARTRRQRLRLGIHTNIHAFADAYRQTQARYLGDGEGGLDQLNMLKELAEGLGENMRRLGRGDYDSPGHSQQWTFRHEYRSGYGGY
jgi:hypothetical protein